MEVVPPGQDGGQLVSVDEVGGAACVMGQHHLVRMALPAERDPSGTVGSWDNTADPNVFSEAHQSILASLGAADRENPSARAAKPAGGRSSGRR